FTEFNEEL
ncbi:unnamed protein product, partial [Rotaria socialis]